MKKIQNRSVLNCIIIFISGCVATLSLPPFSMLPLTFVLGFGNRGLLQGPAWASRFLDCWAHCGFGPKRTCLIFELIHYANWDPPDIY